MRLINTTNARKNLYQLVEEVNKYNEPVLIIGKEHNAVLVSEEEWDLIQENLFLNSIPPQTQTIFKN